MIAQSFSKERVWKDIESQMALHPRYPGSPNHTKMVEWMAGELQKAGWQVEVWEGGTWRPTIYGGREVPIFNVIARWKPERPRKLLFSAHYDTRLLSDSPKTPPNRRNLPVPGANDGASGIAVLMEMARAIAAHPPENVGVILVMHDSEDQGVGPGFQTRHPYQEYAVGAERLAAAWKPADKFEAGVNLDLVGRKDRPLFRKEQFSITFQPALVGEYWAIGEELYPDLFSYENQGMVIDDHLPYLQLGMPLINVIDLDYPQWHTPEDDVAHISADTLQKVGIVTLEFLSRRDRGRPEKP